MNVAEMGAILDDVENAFSHTFKQKQGYENRLAEKDKKIQELTDQVETAESTISADGGVIAALTDKLTRLSALVKGQLPDATASTADSPVLTSAVTTNNNNSSIPAPV